MSKRMLVLAACLLFGACQNAEQNANQYTTATTTVAPPQIQQLSITPRPPDIVEMMRQRGEQDAARPVLKIVEPSNGAVINGTTVAVKIALSGDLKGYAPGPDNNIRLILDDLPGEAYYNLGQPFALRNLSAGRHILRAFPARPWQESYKNPEAFAAVSFSVAGAVSSASPVTSAQQTPEGKNMPASQAGEIDLNNPLLTYSQPQGAYKDAATDSVMLDFWLSNAKLTGDGGAYRVRYTVDGKEPQFLDKWQPVWLTGWATGEHQVKLELVDKEGQVVTNGAYNSVTRKIMLTRKGG